MKRSPPIKQGWKVELSGADGWTMRHPNGLYVVCSYSGGWDHASVSQRGRIPTWEEMCFVKDSLWEPEDCVVQYHPAKSEYVNLHPNCLHLWRPQRVLLPTPPRIMV